MNIIRTQFTILTISRSKDTNYANVFCYQRTSGGSWLCSFTGQWGGNPAGDLSTTSDDIASVPCISFYINFIWGPRFGWGPWSIPSRTATVRESVNRGSKLRSSCRLLVPCKSNPDIRKQVKFDKKNVAILSTLYL